MNLILSNPNNQIEQTRSDAINLIQNTKQITTGIKANIKSTTSLIDNMNQLIKSFNHTASSLQQISDSFSDMVTSNDNSPKAKLNQEEKMSEVVNWASTALDVWKKRKS